MRSNCHPIKLPGFILTACLVIAPLYGQQHQNQVDGNLILFNDNGAWCWYQDERAIVDIATGQLIFGSDASGAGTGGPSRNGRIEGIIYDLESGASKKSVFWQPGCDDHNAPAFLLRPDGKYVTMYAEHYDRYNSRYRIFDGENWGSEQRFDWTTIPGGTDYTIAYSNLYYLSAEGRMYNFARANHRCPNFIYSDDLGETWSFGGQLSTNNTNSYNKGYYRYWSNGVDRIDFILTEEHPRDGLTSMYHGYIKGGKTYATDGTVVDENLFDVQDLPTFLDFTLIFADNTVIDGKAMRKIWNADVMRYDDGTIAAILTARIDNATQGNDSNINPDHAFIYCRYDGNNWSYTYLGQAGKKMYDSEADYTGLGALHPNDPSTIYISTHVDPRTDVDITYREIFKGVTADGGASWTWTPITANSNAHNFRPIIPKWDEQNTILMWFRGSYFAAQRFDAAIVGLIQRDSESKKPKNYVDAAASNTTLSNGADISATGPDSNPGAVDGSWHERTGAGNGGSVFTSAEIGTENAPTLKTTIVGLDLGRYDVWVNFWADPASDWRIKAGLSEERMKLFRQMTSKQVEDADYRKSISTVTSGGLFLYQGYLGRVQLTENNSIEIFVDDETTVTGSGTRGFDNERTWYDGVSYASLDLISSVRNDNNPDLPDSFTLSQNYPNPFNPSTNINFFLTEDAFVRLSIYNVKGRRLASLVNGVVARGKHTVTWQASDFSSGVYYYKLTVGTRTKLRKMLLLK